ncbi:hypothetical protein SDC9_60790 [bioreactor metagenome]|uniref:Phospholipid/glycerol acyltransferase domain-containing protein n=1 Tax=bioreactor metagenome TaxID=1076179 RepID=A0A644XF71_9ZZZZ
MSIVYAILYIIVWPFFNLVNPGRVIGKENIPEGGVLVCANHFKLTDPLYIVFAMGLKNRMQIMAKAELMRVPVLGWLLGKAGIFGIERGKADVGAIKHALKVLKSNEKLLMFPEGTRAKDDDGGAAKTGAVMLALRTGASIVPVYIPRKRKWFVPTPVIIGKPYTPEVAGRRASPEEYHAIADDLMQRIRALGEQVAA